nr:hypothetical protein [Methanobacterium ferruginis]
MRAETKENVNRFLDSVNQELPLEWNWNLKDSMKGVFLSPKKVRPDTG